MKCDPESSLVIAALEAALTSGRLPLTAEATARRLVSRLSSPVRVAILGLPGSGKSELLNMLAGQPIVPRDARLTTIWLNYGKRPRTLVHLPDGRTEPHDGLLPEGVEDAQPERVEIEAPLPILEQISLTEVASDASISSQRAAIAEAVNGADMLLWCTQDFSGAEPMLWSHVPEPLKDHAFLVLAKADELHRDGVLTRRMADLEEVVADEFHSLFPVAARQGLTAVSATPPNSREFTASGGRALVAAILRHVEQGRRADLDNARLFLSQNGFAEQAGAAEAAQPAPPTSPAPAPREPSAPVAADRASAPDSLRDQLLVRLQEGASKLEDVPDDPSADAVAGLLSGCAETADSLAAMFTDPEMEDPGLADLHQDIEEAAEMILLMQIEADATAAADAVTLLLQLRRTIEA